ncbi:uncharacterized protein DUF4124 [Tahibacter aquaticus]|uniref:Uncharacterized protein DUF4124 n=1 Tax=Tahibacter aquaticus TaxID=520092 RepID=A0A4R6YV19_9GAMM|nr:DUF4124 domain-containing protein [Tahibacter aquaticus]TDR42511.1 uncharacterized protein DUF4124 [Tahibacter aquaticus]
MRPIACLCLILLLAGSAQAAVYKCTSPSGAVEFKDKPCAPGTGGEIAVKGVPGSDGGSSKDGPGGSNGSGGGLKGAWCEVSVTSKIDDELDESSPPTQWNFSADSVEVFTPLGPLQAPLIRGEGSFAVDHPMFGGAEREWSIVSQDSKKAVLEGPLGGFYHLRRGACAVR